MTTHSILRHHVAIGGIWDIQVHIAESGQPLHVQHGSIDSIQCIPTVLNVDIHCRKRRRETDMISRMMQGMQSHYNHSR